MPRSSLPHIVTRACQIGFPLFFLFTLAVDHYRGREEVGRTAASYIYLPAEKGSSVGHSCIYLRQEEFQYLAEVVRSVERRCAEMGLLRRELEQ